MQILIIYATQEGITVVKTTAYQCICQGDGDRFRKKFVHAAKVANLTVAQFLYIIDLVSKRESSIKNYTQIANLVDKGSCIINVIPFYVHVYRFI